MQQTIYRPVKFSRTQNKEFLKELRSRVKSYFEEKNISKHANAEMIFKTFFMLALYFVPYALMMTGVVAGTWGIFAMYILMGLGLAGIGMSVMHDANHGSYSANSKVNKWVGMTLDLVGGYAANWKIQHNRLHHSFTNIEGHDEDIAPGVMLRFSPHAKRREMHRFQHLYAWFFYGLMTFYWVVGKDFIKLADYRKRGLITKKDGSYQQMLIQLIATKTIYIAYMVVLPILVLPIVWWQSLIFFFMLHFTAGFVLACVFQLAHVMPHCEYPTPNDKNTIEENWAIHQLQTTMNFAPNNKVLSWYVGGLNYQVEHHLFPNICHIHYRGISKIVEETATEYGIPYHSEPSFLKAVGMHAKMLKDLGRE